MFKQAIEDLENSGNLVGQPQSFHDYAIEQGFDIAAKRTAQYISINTFPDLQAELRDSGCMVFRLGAPIGSRYTHFCLAKTLQDFDDYFFMDKTLFSDIPLEDFTPKPSDNLLAYQLLPTLTETSLVNLAMASGLLPHALGLNTSSYQPIPATGQSVFSFDFKPLAAAHSLHHHRGQVEIDGLFVGDRNGQRCAFVLEAKSGKRLESLAKHKLLYPLLAIQPQLPEDMPIIPVYLRTVRNMDSVEFNIVECTCLLPDQRTLALDQLLTTRISRFRLVGF